MILRPQLEPTDHQSVLDYYLAHYDEVHILSCNKCGADLGIEIRGEVSGYKINDNGFTVLPFGDSLLASRVRSDGSMGYQCGAMIKNPAYDFAMLTWEKTVEAKKVDYENSKRLYDARYAKTVKKNPNIEYLPPEYYEVPKPLEPQLIRCMNDTRGTPLEEELSPTGTFLPHEVAAIKQRQFEIGWKPKVKHQGNKEIHETFTRERIK